MRKSIVRFATLAIPIALLSFQATSPAVAAAEYSWSAFGSFGMGRVNRDDLVFFDYEGKDLSFDSDTMAAAQFNATSSSGLGVTAQFVMRGYDSSDVDNQYHPRTEWFFGSWQSGNDFRIRLGRLRIPFFAYSESLEVGYSYPWVRPPTEMYAPLFERTSSMDGASADFYGSIGEQDLILQVGTGKAETSHAGYDATFDPIYLATVSVANEVTRFRYGIFAADQFVTSATGLQAAESFRLLGSEVDPVYDDIADSLSADDVRVYYHSVGAGLNLDDYTLEAEAYYAPPEGDQFSVKSRGGYVSLSHQAGRWIPYVLLGRYHNEIDPEILARIDRSEAVALPPGSLGTQLAQLTDATRESLLALHSENRSLTLGVRYDLNSNFALKAAYGFYRMYQPNSGPFDYADPANKRDYSTAQLFTLVLDWVL